MLDTKRHVRRLRLNLEFIKEATKIRVSDPIEDHKTRVERGFLPRILDVNGVAYAESGSAFSITADTITVALKSSTDKVSYLPGDTVQLNERLSNLTQNLALNNLHISISVKNPDGSLRFSRTETVVQLSAAAFKDYSDAMALNSAAAGQYTVTTVVTNDNGATLAQASSTFLVGSSAIASL